jgi:hypothetical protein
MSASVLSQRFVWQTGSTQPSQVSRVQRTGKAIPCTYAPSIRCALQFTRTVSGAAPTAGSELIRKRSPSGENRILKQNDAWCDDSSVEQNVGDSGHHFAVRGIYRDRHQPLVRINVVEFLAIPTPTCLRTAAVRNLKTTAGTRERRNKHLGRK